MSQLTGAFTVEVDLNRLADAIADRVLGRLHDAAQAATGSDDYEREPEPGLQATGRPWPGARYDDDSKEE